MPGPIRLLANARDIIELLAEERELSHAEVAERTGMPRASVYRLIDGLQSIGLVAVGTDSLLRLTSEWLHLADAAAAGLREWARVHPVLEEVASTTGQTVFVCVPRNHRAFCIDWVPGRALEVLVLRPGRSLPPNLGAAGRVVLAHDPDVDEVLASDALVRATPHSLVTRDELRSDIQRTRAEGFVVSVEDATEGIGAIGVPLFSDREQLVGVVSLAGVSDEVLARQAEFLDALAAAATKIEALLQ